MSELAASSAVESLSIESPVLIVGAGPVGLLLASELTRFGVPVRVVEKNATRTDKSKALVLWSRTIELIDRMGIAARFVDAGMKVSGVNMLAGGSRFAHVSLGGLPTPHPYALMLPQSDTERLLEEDLAERGVRVEREVEMTGFVPDRAEVAVELRRADGSTESVVTPWLIGCDGAHSAVRHGLGMAFEGSTLPSNWLLADVHLTGVPTPADELAMFFDSAGPLAIFPISPGRYRVIANVEAARGSDVPAVPTLAEVQAELDRRGLPGVRASAPIWISAFHINERKVADYRAGRVFLVGDAAHVHSPAGGQGMNTGMQDAFNLAWKLALVVRGEASEEPLLSSYSTERSAVGRQVLADAGRLTAAALLQGEWLQSIRNHAASLLLGFGPVRNAMTRKLSELSIGYPESPLTDRSHRVHVDPACGERAPVASSGRCVGDGDRPRFALFAAAGAGSAALIAKFDTLLDAEMRAPFEEGAIWLVRPDGYVASVASSDDWSSIDLYLARLAVKANDLPHA